MVLNSTITWYVKPEVHILDPFLFWYHHNPTSIFPYYLWAWGTMITPFVHPCGSISLTMSAPRCLYMVWRVHPRGATCCRHVHLHIPDWTSMTWLKWKTRDVVVELTYKPIGPQLTFLVGMFLLALELSDKFFRQVNFLWQNLALSMNLVSLHKMNPPGFYFTQRTSIFTGDYSVVGYRRDFSTPSKIRAWCLLPYHTWVNLIPT